MAQLSNEEDLKKLQPMTAQKIIEQLGRALIDIKDNQNEEDFRFNNIENIPMDFKNKSRPEFIGKELMLFEMIGILNGKITELQKKYEKIKNIESREEEFVSSKANEITVPIQDIFDYAKLAKSGHLDPIEALNEILAVAKKIQTATTVVLDTNRITNNSLILSKKNHNINKVIIECIEEIKNSNNKIPIKLGLDNEIEIPIDKMRLTQVIQTLLSNSVKYTETGGIKVESFVAHHQNLVIIRINDTGRGIPENLLPNIFNKKNRGDQIRDEKLSLFLCKGIILSHGGKITVKNNVTQGCTFTITLPIKQHLH